MTIMEMDAETILNFEIINNLLKELNEEYNLESRLSRYESMSPELLKLAESNGLRDNLDKTRALFVADFLFTSSELPVEISDEDRRISIIKIFKIGLETRSDKGNLLLDIYYTASKLGTLIRRNNSFMAGRGIEKSTRLFLLYDLFVLPFVYFCETYLGKGNQYWEISVFSSFLIRKRPDQIYSEISKDDFNKINTHASLWNLLEQYSDVHNIDVDNKVVLPYINDSKCIYSLETKKLPLVSAWNTFNIEKKEVIQAINKLHEFMNRSDSHNQLIYLKSRLQGHDANILFTRNPNPEGKPFYLMLTPAEEINVTIMMDLLGSRGLVDENWLYLKDLTQMINESSFEKKKEKVEETIKEEVKQKKSSKEAKKPAKKKKGIFGRIFGIFSKKSEETDKTSDSDSSKTVKTVVERKVIKEVTKNVERKKQIGVLLPQFISHGLGITSLSDLRLLEKFDTIRESEYEIVGSLETEFSVNKTYVLTTPKLGSVADLSEILDGLDEVFEKVIKYGFDIETQIIPKEILFLSNNNKRYIICMDGNKERLVGTIAITYEKEFSGNYQPKGSVEPLQRRSIHMRTGQLLSARNHTPFDRATERIYGDSLGKDVEIKTLDHAILPLT